MPIRPLALALLFVLVAGAAAEAQVQVRIRSRTVTTVTTTTIAPGTTLAGRRVASAPGDPSCLVTHASDWWGQAEMQMLVPHTRVGEWRAAVTPAFGICRRPQNPFRARLIVFHHATDVGGQAVLRRGSLSCVMRPGNVGDILVCNRPLRCDVTKHRCVNP